MPSLATMQNDEAFLTLLSSQRELLNKLNQESALRREQISLGHCHHVPPKRGSFLGFDDQTLMNKPIIERRASLDMLFSRRFSLGMGNDNFIVSNPFPEHERSDNFMDACTFKLEFDAGDHTTRKMKRRRSSMTLLSSIFFDDPKQARRLSILSLTRPSEIMEACFDQDVMLSEPQFDRSPCKKPRIDQDVFRGKDSCTTPGADASASTGMDPGTVKNTMVSFASAMEKSAKSQQDIHDWDRQMGLKRSHSKTMRLTMRSRKKLRSILKKEINSYTTSTSRLMTASCILASTINGK